MSEMGKIRTVLINGITEYRRSYVFLALLLFLPVYFISLVVFITPDEDVTVWTRIDGISIAISEPLPEVYAVVMTLLVGSLLTGIGGLFMMQRSRDADRRLVLTGYSPLQLIIARFAILVLVLFAVVVLSLGVMLPHFVPEQSGWFVVGMVLGSLIYGLIGIIVGVLLDRLAGTYVMLFGPMLDVLVLQNPTVRQGEPELWIQLLPGHYPIELMFNASFAYSVPPNSVGWSLVYFISLAMLATVAVYQTIFRY